MAATEAAAGFAAAALSRPPTASLAPAITAAPFASAIAAAVTSSTFSTAALSTTAFASTLPWRDCSHRRATV